MQKKLKKSRFKPSANGRTSFPLRPQTAWKKKCVHRRNVELNNKNIELNKFYKLNSQQMDHRARQDGDTGRADNGAGQVLLQLRQNGSPGPRLQAEDHVQQDHRQPVRQDV